MTLAGIKPEIGWPTEAKRSISSMATVAVETGRVSLPPLAGLSYVNATLWPAWHYRAMPRFFFHVHRR